MEFHNLDKLKKLIESVDHNDWKKFDHNTDIDSYLTEKKKKFEEYFGEFPPNLIMPSISNKNWRPKIFRARPLDKKMKLDDIREHRYPPKEIADTLRANLAGFPVFYSSRDAVTIMHELVQNENDFNSNAIYCLSIWEIKPDTNMIVAPFLMRNTHSLNPYGKVGESILNRLHEKIEDKSTIEKVDFILGILSHLFTLENYHGISSFIAHKYLYDTIKPVDILIYPSIRLDKKSVNFAIHPNFVDNYLDLEAIVIASIVNSESLETGAEQLSFRVSNFAVFDNGTIKWKDPYKNKKELEEILKARD